MLFVCLSDTHGFQEKMLNKVPEADVLLHCGDFTGYGTGKEIKKLNAWFGTLPHKYKIVIAGNHDGACERRTPEQVQAIFTNAIYLYNSGVEIEGIKIWGSPFTPQFGNWYFMAQRGSLINTVWQKIPQGIDILMTHGPSMGKLDWSIYGNEHVGCEDLRRKIKEIKPKKHIFGHIHGSYGVTRDQDTEYINCSICNESYQPVNKPILFNL